MARVSWARFMVPPLAAATFLLGVVPPALAAPTATPTVGCADVLFVGARGSGEPGTGTPGWTKSSSDPTSLGPTVQSAYSEVVRQLTGHRALELFSVNYPANAVRTAVFRPDIYFAGLGLGVNGTVNKLTSAHQSCPNQRFVLGGYSQGAMVMHRVLRLLGASVAGNYKDILARIDGAILIGDGDAVQGDSILRYGTADSNARGIGQVYRTQSGSSPVKFGANVNYKVRSVCNARDVVCDFRGWNAEGVGIHLAYPNSAIVRNAAAAVADGVRARPLPAAATATGAVGAPFSTTLVADVASPYTLQWRLAPTSAALPSGLTLSAAGVLAGTPTISGTFTLAVQVRTVALGITGEWVPSVLSLRISAAQDVPPPHALVLSHLTVSGPTGYGLASPDGRTVWGTTSSSSPASLTSVDLTTGLAHQDPWVPGVTDGSERTVSTADGALWYTGALLMRRSLGGTWTVAARQPFDYLAAAPDSSVWATPNTDDGHVYNITKTGVVRSYAVLFPILFHSVAVTSDGTAWTIQRTGNVRTDVSYLVGYRTDGSVVSHVFPYGSVDPGGKGLRPVEIYPRPDGSLWWLADNAFGDFGDEVGTMSPAGAFVDTNKLPGYPPSVGTMTVDNQGRLWGDLETYDAGGLPTTTTLVVSPSSVTPITDPLLVNVGFGVNLHDGRLAFSAADRSIVVVDSSFIP